MVSNKLQLY